MQFKLLGNKMLSESYERTELKSGSGKSCGVFWGFFPQSESILNLILFYSALLGNSWDKLALFSQTFIGALLVCTASHVHW